MSAKIMPDGTAYISRKEFEDWVALVGGEITRQPDYRSSKLAVSGKMENGVAFMFEATAIAVTKAGRFFGRCDEWNAIKLLDSACRNFHFFGQGARDQATWKAADESFDILMGR